MAKSLRSKHKRKMRAIKRERYAVKELAMLKKIVEPEETMPEETKPQAVLAASDPIQSRKDHQGGGTDVEEMEVANTKRNFDKMKPDKFGNYPSWMSQRSIQKLKLHMKKKKISKRSGKVTKHRRK